MADNDRRTNAAGEGPQRRMGDRRDSPRIPVKMWVRMVEAGGSFEEKEGDVAVGGAYFEDKHLPVGKQVQLRFTLPGKTDEIRCDGEILRISEQADKFGAHVRFIDMPTDAELSIARYIDEQELNKKQG